MSRLRLGISLNVNIVSYEDLEETDDDITQDGLDAILENLKREVTDDINEHLTEMFGLDKIEEKEIKVDFSLKIVE